MINHISYIIYHYRTVSTLYRVKFVYINYLLRFAHSYCRYLPATKSGQSCQEKRTVHLGGFPKGGASGGGVGPMGGTSGR